ncbi:hypothetical protein O0V09_11975 [Dasania sp. GY-19]|uniref:Uncharacterized protein n=1 Tax=Dasania phycosphaerae TaxID=2950436 RepID=A0A9J6RN55_9GAMM|nr:hypothetical protein [Dasania phycosphaerae]MCZ0865924.1 hypothetical protein [Dasania phycosphaerae]
MAFHYPFDWIFRGKGHSKASVIREINQSTTVPDSGYMVRDEKTKGFFCLDHRTVDGKCNIITDVHDSVPYLKLPEFCVVYALTSEIQLNYYIHHWAFLCGSTALQIYHLSSI